MSEKFWLTADETQKALAGISKSTLRRRIKELNLFERGYILRLGRRLLFSSSLISDLPDLVSNATRQGGQKNG